MFIVIEYIVAKSQVQNFLKKEKDNPIYGKYRNIYAKKAMNVKRNPDIATYKEQYEKWKKTAKQFIKDIQNGVETYEEFDKWLDNNS